MKSLFRDKASKIDIFYNVFRIFLLKNAIQCIGLKKIIAQIQRVEKSSNFHSMPHLYRIIYGYFINKMNFFFKNPHLGIFLRGKKREGDDNDPREGMCTPSYFRWSFYPFVCWTDDHRPRVVVFIVVIVVVVESSGRK